MMTRQTPRRLVAGCLIVSTLSAVVIVVFDSLPRRGDDAAGDEFQSLVGGLGLGSSVDLSDCSFSFDPRLEPACSQVVGPIPAGFFLCPRHVGGATGYRSLPPSPIPRSEPDDHATAR